MDEALVIEKDLNYICKSLSSEFSMMEGAHLLITGGAGFLGYYMVKSIIFWNKNNLELKPIQITIYDNLMRGAPQWLTEDIKNSNVTLIKHDITQPLPIDADNFDYIIHAASIASPIYYRINPIETMDANVNGLRYLLDYCKNQKNTKTPVKGFLYFSTSEIYGDPTSENIPTPETYRGNVSCTGPRACYDESKRYGETLCVNFAQTYDLPIKIARPFNNYGPGLKITDRRALPDFSRDIFNNKNIVMYSDGSPTRTFCYIADAIIGYYKILMLGLHGESYNIGVEKPEISMKDFAQKLIDIAKKEFGYQGILEFKVSADKEYLTDNPNRRCPVIAKAKRDLNYAPQIDIDEGLLHSMYWYKENLIAEEA